MPSKLDQAMNIIEQLLGVDELNGDQRSRSTISTINAAIEFLGANGRQQAEELDPLTEKNPLSYKEYRYNQFVSDMMNSEFTPYDYNGRNLYHGPAVNVSDDDERQAVIRATNVLLQYDTLGKSGYVIYPR